MVRRPTPPRRPRRLTSAGTVAGKAEASAGQDHVPTADLAGTGPIEIAGEDLAVFDTGSIPRLRGEAPVAGPGSAAAGSRTGGRVFPAVGAAEGTGKPATGEVPRIRGARRRREAAEPADLSARRAERRAERRRYFSVRAAAIAGIVAFAAVFVYAVFFSPLFALDAAKIEVRAPEGTTVETADIAGTLGAREGVSLFRLVPASLARDVEEKVARTGNVKVDRVLPHGLRVSFDDRSPIACLVRAEQCVAIDEAGREVVATEEEMANLTRISYASAAENSGRYALDILDIVSALPDGLGGAVVVSEVAKAGQITLVFDDGRLVRWGMPGQTDEKVAVLEVLVEEPAAMYDVSVPRSPLVGPSPVPTVSQSEGSTQQR